MPDYSKYIDNSAPIGVPIRKHSKCPFCGHRNATGGFVVIPDRKGHLLFCHYCGKKKWIPRRGFSPSVVRQLLSTPKRKVYPDVTLPTDYGKELPAVGLVWLYKYDIPDHVISNLEFGYSEKYHRLIMPCKDEEGTLIHWQGRYLGNFLKDGTPKYITRTKSGSYYWVYNPSNSCRAVLVEDMISAIKVGMSGYAGVCLFGSYLKDETINNVAQKFKQLTVWLDPDKRKNATKYVKRFSSFGYNFTGVLTADKDPKDYTTIEIQQYLK